MRRRLGRLILVGVVVPVAAKAAVTVADRLEVAKGPTVVSRSLRQAGHLASGRSRRSRWR
jgi:hypothetical protein